MLLNSYNAAFWDAKQERNKDDVCLTRVSIFVFRLFFFFFWSGPLCEADSDDRARLPQEELKATIAEKLAESRAKKEALAASGAKKEWLPAYMTQDREEATEIVTMVKGRRKPVCSMRDLLSAFAAYF
eukprot:SAG11_NODE_6232_length_1357_cov_1.270270_1_plen_128_part_00